MEFIILAFLFFFILAGAIFSFRFGLKWFYVFVAASTGAFYLMNFLQVSILGQLLLLGESFIAVNFLMSDVVSEHYGREKARLIIPIVLSSMVFLWGCTYLGHLLPAVEGDPFHAILGSLLSFYTLFTVVLIVIVYTFLQYVDTWLYEVIRGKTKGRWLWMRNIGSTLVTQSIDVVVSYGILVRIIFPELTILETGSLMLSAAVFKYSMAFLDTPFVYLSYKFRPKELLENKTIA